MWNRSVGLGAESSARLQRPSPGCQPALSTWRAPQGAEGWAEEQQAEEPEQDEQQQEEEEQQQQQQQQCTTGCVTDLKPALAPTLSRVTARTMSLMDETVCLFTYTICRRTGQGSVSQAGNRCSGAHGERGHDGHASY